MPDTDLIPDPKGVKDHTFLKNRRQRSLSITMSRDRLFHFQCKKTLCPIPRLFQRSKVVSINLPILPFLNLKISASVDAHLCFWLLVSGDTGHRCDLCLSEREKLPREGEGRNFLLLIETKWRMAPGLVPTLRQRARDPTLRNKNYGQGYRSCPLPRSLSIVVDHDL